MKTRRRSGRGPLLFLFFIFVVSSVALALQHHLLYGFGDLDSAYNHFVSDFAPSNSNGNGTSTDVSGGSGSILRSKSSPTKMTATSGYPYHTCSILDRTIKIPEAPHFIIAGAQKCGTSALLAFLTEHPKIESSSSLEPHFFDWHYPSDVDKEEWLTDRNLSTNLPDPDFQCALKQAYGEQFQVLPNTTADTFFFEKTPSYLFLARVPALIQSTCFQKPKIIVILRNPVDRAFSHFRMKVRTEGRSFEDLVDQEIDSLRSVGLSNAPLRISNYRKDDPAFQIPDLTPGESERRHWKHYRKMFANNYLQRGMYMTQLKRWMELFPLGESLLVLNYERFKANPQEVFFQLLDFVGAPRFVPTEGFGTKYNTKDAPKTPISAETRHYLSAFFRPYNEMLANELGESWRGVWD